VSLLSWAEFARAAPDFAAAGMRLLVQGDGVAIGFLASVGAGLHLAPVCPIFCVDAVYVSVGRRTPKRRDLDADGRFVLHALLGRNDEEFRIDGRASIVSAERVRAAVHAAIRFGAFDRADPIYRLDIGAAMWGFWENVGRPGTRPVRRFFDVDRGVRGPIAARPAHDGPAKR
jgi:hypothetical protein